MQADRTNPLPLYIQVREDIRSQIEAGRLLPGDRLLLESASDGAIRRQQRYGQAGPARSGPRRPRGSHQAKRDVRFAAEARAAGFQAADEDPGPDHSRHRGLVSLGDLPRTGGRGPPGRLRRVHPQLRSRDQEGAREHPQLGRACRARRHHLSELGTGERRTNFRTQAAEVPLCAGQSLFPRHPDPLRDRRQLRRAPAKPWSI